MLICLDSITAVTDRQTDRQTDGQTDTPLMAKSRIMHIISDNLQSP